MSFRVITVLFSALLLASSTSYAQVNIDVSIEGGNCPFITIVQDNNQNPIGYRIAESQLLANVIVTFEPNLQVRIESQEEKFPPAQQEIDMNPQYPRILALSSIFNGFSPEGNSELTEVLPIEAMVLMYGGEQSFFIAFRNGAGGAISIVYGSESMGLICADPDPSLNGALINFFVHTPSEQVRKIQTFDVGSFLELSDKYNQKHSENSILSEQLGFTTGESSEKSEQIDSLQQQIGSLNESLSLGTESQTLCEDKLARTESALQRVYSLNKAAERDITKLTDIAFNAYKQFKKAIRAIKKGLGMNKVNKALKKGVAQINRQVEN